MTQEGLYTNINYFNFYMPDAITPFEMLIESKVKTECSYFDKEKQKI